MKNRLCGSKKVARDFVLSSGSTECSFWRLQIILSKILVKKWKCLDMILLPQFMCVYIFLYILMYQLTLFV